MNLPHLDGDPDRHKLAATIEKLKLEIKLDDCGGTFCYLTGESGLNYKVDMVKGTTSVCKPDKDGSPQWYHVSIVGLGHSRAGADFLVSLLHALKFDVKIGKHISTLKGLVDGYLKTSNRPSD